MNYKKACTILDLVDVPNISIELLKKKYRLNALTFHPDKNPSPDASSKFQEINEAYQYLLKHLEFIESDDEDEDNEDSDFYESDDKKTSYNSILYSFLKNVMINNSEKWLYMVIQKISNTCEQKALDTLEKMDKKILIKIYEIIHKYKEAFHFSKDFFDKIEMVLDQRLDHGCEHKCSECIILNPTIDDLFESNLYKLTVNGLLYIVPLWHHELVYDNSGNDIYVNCYPMLSDKIRIDDNNNIHVKYLSYHIQDILGKPLIEFTIGKKKCSFVPSDLKIIPFQTLVLVNQGISKINAFDIYDITKKSDIILYIELK